MAPLPVPVKFTMYWRQVGYFHVFTCPEIDPTITVIDRNYDAAIQRAETLFGVEIARPQEPEAA